MSFRKLFSGISLWASALKKSDDSDSASCDDNGLWLGRHSTESRRSSSDWLSIQDSFPSPDMTPGSEKVLKQGFLYKKRERTTSSLRRPWQSGYFVLKKSNAYTGLLLDEYRDASLRVAKQTLFLNTVKYVGPVNTSKSKQHAFQVVVMDRSPLLFACDNELLKSEWISVFNKCTEESPESYLHGRTSPEGGPSAAARQTRLPTNGIYIDARDDANQKPTAIDTKGYEVKIQSTSLSVANNLQSNYILKVTKSRIHLKQLDRKEDVLSWPLTQLRGFKSQPQQQQIVLETGRSCHFGKGRLICKSKYYESIIQDIRDAITLQDSRKPLNDTSSCTSSESDSEITHKPARRCVSDQQCSVTVSVRPRRTHSERVISQVAVGRAPSNKSVSISPTFFVNTNNNVLRVPNSGVTDDKEETVFDFEDKGIKSPKASATNWKTSQTFSKTMIEAKSDTEGSSTELTDNDVDRHSYIDIIAEKEIEKPLTSDAASTLLAQVVADLTEPQKKCFIKSKSTGGIKGTLPINNEARRASAPAVPVGDLDFPQTGESELQDGLAVRKFKLEKINEVSFTDNSDGEKLSNHQISPVGSNSLRESTTTTVDKNSRMRSMSERISSDHGSPNMAFHKKRSKTTLHSTHSETQSSLTDLTSNESPQKNRGLKQTLSHSSIASMSHQLAKDPLSFGFASGSGKVPSFPKRSVVKAVESVGGVDNSRTKLNMSPLPKEFHSPEPIAPNESFNASLSTQLTCNAAPPRPPKDNDSKPRKQNSCGRENSPPPLPERLPSPTMIQMSTQDKPTSPRPHWLPDALNKPYANAPPKVQPRIPNAMPRHTVALSNSAEPINPPPRPPKPDGPGHSYKKSNAKSFCSKSPPQALMKRVVSERRTSARYSWEIDHNVSADTAKDSSPQLERVKKPIVTVTPPRSPVMERCLKTEMRGLSFSESDIADVFAGKSIRSSTSASFQSANLKASYSSSPS